MYMLVGTKSVTRLVFITDMLCFIKAYLKSIWTLRTILHELSQLTGMMINKDKSGIFLTKSYREDATLLAMLVFPSKQLPILHLGIPVVGRQLQNSDCVIFLDQLKSYRSLSYGGHIQLANWAMYGRLIYWFQGIYLPVGTMKKARNIRYRFIWNEKREMSGPTWQGRGRRGVGQRDPKNFNTTFLIKRMARLWENDTIWTSWIKRCHLKARALEIVGKVRGDSLCVVINFGDEGKNKHMPYVWRNYEYASFLGID